jgi:hypothetical protein
MDSNESHAKTHIAAGHKENHERLAAISSVAYKLNYANLQYLKFLPSRPSAWCQHAIRST